MDNQNNYCCMLKNIKLLQLYVIILTSPQTHKNKEIIVSTSKLEFEIIHFGVLGTQKKCY